MPRLRVVAGPSLDALVPISVNSDVPHDIVSDAFEGQIIAYIKDFPDEEGNASPSEYFDREDRKGVTWSIQVQGMLCLFNLFFPPKPSSLVWLATLTVYCSQEDSFDPSLRMTSSSETRLTVP